MSAGGGDFNIPNVFASGSPFGGLTGGNILQGVSSGIGGIASDILGQSQVASLMGQAAGAQLGQQRADRALALQMMQPTPQMIQQMEQAMAVNQQSIKQAQDLLASTDPALMEAGRQAVALMQGKEAATLAPVQNQRARQRADLEAQLAQQLGPGYRTSSAGIQALNNFDQETANLMANVQQGVIGQYMGAAATGSQLGQQRQQAGVQNYGDLYRLGMGQQGLQLNALLGTPVDPGLAYAGQLQQARYNAQNISDLFNFAQQAFAGSGGFGGGGGAGGLGGGAGGGSIGGAGSVGQRMMP